MTSREPQTRRAQARCRHQRRRVARVDGRERRAVGADLLGLALVVSTWLR
jgi:hypothetical protein